MTFAAALFVAALAADPPPQPQAPAPPLLVVLTTTGETVDGLPVLAPHPDAQRYLDVLSRGFSGRLLRLYALTQEFQRRTGGRVPEPAYLALTGKTGGFPRTGFVMGGTRKPAVGWVDLRSTSAISGRYGAIDQIFPHELLHVIATQLGGPPRQGSSTQVHALGVRTDPLTAFHEGFAEHAQIMAIDDPDAAPDTRALIADAEITTRAESALVDYATDLTRHWWPIQRQRLRFPLWYSQTEQVMRYHAVKSNRLARTPETPPSLAPYDSYLWRSIVLPAASAPLRSAAVQLSIDGPVAHLFWRLATDEALQRRYLDPPFYAQFGVSPSDISPSENVYLKMFATIATARPSSTVELLRGWARMAPADADDLARVTAGALGTAALPAHPELWLANGALMTGTTIFDQYRSLPQVHTFDVNAAEVFDWHTVPGVTPATASALVAGAPYASLDGLLSHPAVDAGLRAQIQGMSHAMTQRSRRDGVESLSLTTLLRGFVWRVGLLIFVATLPAAWLARRAGIRRAVSAGLVGLTGTLIVTVLAWGVVAPWWLPIPAPLIVCGLPWAVVALLRHRTAVVPLIALRAWLVAGVPAGFITFPW